MSQHHYRFVGGSQDGRSIPVPEPIHADMEFLVRPEPPFLPWEPYRLGDDGQFHFEGLKLHDEPLAAFDAPRSRLA